MDLPRQSARVGAAPVRAWLTPQRVVLYSALTLVIYVLFMVIWTWLTLHASGPVKWRLGADYSVFWSASWLTLHGTPAAQIYDFARFSRASAALFPHATRYESFLAWLYPPTYLLMVAPLALLPFAVSYPLFVAAGTAALGVAVARVSGIAALPGVKRFGWLVLLACPGLFVTSMFGQNAMYTASCAALAVYWAERRPAWAGFCIGLLAIKPQLALLFPFVLIAARAWRTFAWAALFATVFAALGVLACGTETLHLFVANTGLVRALTLEHGVVFWLASPTPFAALRLAGLTLAQAYGAQAAIALIAISAACVVWARTHDTRLRGAALAVATLAANPYLWHYELAWLGIPLACVTAIGWRDGWLRGEQTLVACMWALPIYEYLNPWMELPQIGSVVTLAALLALLRRVRAGAGARIDGWRS
ncbi:glycosyltransferase family 87 protein [Burkholderia sp. Ac-20353]|uniref:glycosyltransferase family 87 protein n=1 Tax=Burkholderia sp. Ac-20353 TaxID=2703894 RepID=UPI00197B8969|nr:glycosyltransferase family 87 protein [Burkholderia sp. Ac-20353]MBN3792813.1 DUF2029 domain-containing protein [Burkholderia sp. Ac-20353]